MSKNVMLVFSHQDTGLRQDIEDAIERCAADNVLVIPSKNRSDAFKKKDEMRIDFFVIGMSLANDPRTGIEEEGGLVLCEFLRKNGVRAPIALIAPSVGNVLTRRCAELGDVSPYAAGPGLGELLAAQVEKYEPPAKILDIVLKAKQGALWEYSLHGTHFDFQKHGFLEMDDGLLRLAKTLSTSIGDAPRNWYAPFKELGQTITEHLCRAGTFRADLSEGLRGAGGLERTRITLSVDKSHYPIALEAIFPPAGQPEVPWMVRAPLSRNVGSAVADTKRLFGQAMSPLNVLLVSANVSGFTDQITDEKGGAHYLRELEQVERECAGLHTLLRKPEREFTIGRVMRLVATAEQPLTRHLLLDTLASTDWDIVHFAGHSLSRQDGPRENRGYLFVGSPGAPEPIEIADIASFLESSRLVYLSSCESASSPFAVDLAQRGVPTVIGFRWPVNDMFAALHAHLFYRHLFEERAIEKAFLNTRKAIYRRYSDRDRVWASSMLVMGAVR